METKQLEMEKYIGIKLIQAKPMTRLEYNVFRRWVLPEDENGSDEGYLVEYLDGGKPNVEGYDGYVSWSPKEQFDNAYRLIDCMSFGHALEAMKKGLKLARKNSNFHVQCDLDDNSTIKRVYFSYYADRIRVLYHPSQFDIDADDWYIVD